MQKENPVIKNYIYSSQKRLLIENDRLKTTDNSIYHLLLMQNTVSPCLFLLRK